MNTPHTPGDWLATEELAGVERHDFEITAGTQLVAIVEQTADIEVGRANARLISASPDLLEALRGTMASLARVLDKHDPDSNEYEWIGEANEAILKATTTPDK